MKKLIVAVISTITFLSSAYAQGANTAFNPSMSLILETGYSSFSGDLEENAIAGFQGGEAEGVVEQEGFYLGHQELTFSSNIDSLFFGQGTVALHEHDGSTETEVEEAFVQTLGLPWGISLKAGRMLPIIGYLNEHHLHVDYFVERPLASQVFLGGEYVDDGVQASIVLPTDLYLELGGGVFAGNSYPATRDDEVGSATVYGRMGGDIGEDLSWRVGLSWLHAQPKAREPELHDHDEEVDHDDVEQHDHLEPVVFDGDSDSLVTELKLQWLPTGNSKEQLFELLGEFFVRREDGLFSTDEVVSDTQVSQQGWYLQAVYKFLPEWSVGYRRDQLYSDSSLADGLHGTLIDAEGFDPSADTVQIQYSSSEFSRIRGSYKIQRYSDSNDEHLLLVNLIVSLGSHGAHSY